MAGEFCLDTNIAVAFLNGHPEVIARVGTASRVALPAPTVGELLFGAKSPDDEKPTSKGSGRSSKLAK